MDFPIINKEDFKQNGVMPEWGAGSMELGAWYLELWSSGKEGDRKPETGDRIPIFRFTIPHQPLRFFYAPKSTI
jgi:hypothetical protein